MHYRHIKYYIRERSRGQKPVGFLADFLFASLECHISVKTSINHRQLDCFFFQVDINANNKAPHHWPFVRGNLTVTGGFPSQRASNVASGGKQFTWPGGICSIELNVFIMLYSTTVTASETTFVNMKYKNLTNSNQISVYTIILKTMQILTLIYTQRRNISS